MRWAFAINAKETHRQHVAEATDETLDTVLGYAELPCMMLDDNFSDFESLHSCKRWNHAVKLAKEADGFCDFATVTLETAIVIVKLHFTEVAQHPIEHTAGQHLVPRIVSNGFPTAYQIVSFMNLCDEARNLFCIILKVSVHGENQFALGNIESGL